VVVDAEFIQQRTGGYNLVLEVEDRLWSIIEKESDSRIGVV
jgi:hypothetical protein